MAPATDPVLAVRGLGVAFGGAVRALAGVDLDVRHGDFVAVLGPSGAGKSTLLRALNGLVTPTEGRVMFRGRPVGLGSGAELRALRRHVGMVFQRFNLVPRVTVLDNVLAGRLRFAGGPVAFTVSHLRRFGREHRRVALDALAQVGLEEKAHQRVDELSGGQCQRVAIARVLAQEPAVILADEPIASLDPRSAERVMDILREIHEQRGVPVIVNLHQPDVAERYARRIVLLRAGRIVRDGGPEVLDARTRADLYEPDRDGEDTPARPAIADAGATPCVC